MAGKSKTNPETSKKHKSAKLYQFATDKTTVEKNRPRINLDGKDVTVNPRGLIEMQLSSYADFLQRDVPAEKRDLYGLHSAFHAVFPISSTSEHIVLEYLGYEIGETTYDVNSCLLRGKTYSAPLQVKLRLVVYDKEQLPERLLEHQRTNSLHG